MAIEVASLLIFYNDKKMYLCNLVGSEAIGYL